jgi:ABC-type multidrug transport system ATPase subunit
MRQLLLLPLIILIAIDISLILGFCSLKIRHKLRASSRTHLSNVRESKERLVSTTSSLKNQDANEKESSNGQDLPYIGRSYVPEQDTISGFETASTTNTLQVMHEDAPNLDSFIKSIRRATDTIGFGLSFGYSALSYMPRGVANPILQSMTGNIKAGSLVAVMGGSGAGKSTFVNVLMGKLHHTGGRVTINNEAAKVKHFKKLIGYVPQDDIVFPELTVYENILHSAKTRLPKRWSVQDVQSHVDSVINCLQISSVRNSLVGSVAKPVLSGGERKRVSIGLELAAAPMAIFLDEPTSGLDAAAASSVMRILKELARLGITIVVIIHQPRMEIFNMLDDLILLGDGQTIYEGPQKDVRRYFENIGYAFPEYMNHGDIITDIITGNGGAYKKKGEVSAEALVSHWSANRPNHSFLNVDCTNKTTFGYFIQKLPSLVSTHISRRVQGQGAGRIFQIWLSLKRALLQQYRSSGTIAAELGLCSLAGVLLGLAQEAKKGVLFVGEYNGPYSILSRAHDFQSAPEVSLLVSIAIGLVAGAPGVRTFSEERLLYRREAEAGHSRIAYFIAKVLSVIPRMALTCLHFTAPLFLLMAPVMPWWIAYVANFLYFYCIYGLASCVSMVVSREDAPLFSTMISLITGILGGCAPSMERVKEWNVEWLWRLSPATWMAELHIGQLLLPVGKLFDIDMGAERMGFELEHLGIDMVALLVIGTVYRAVAFILMVVGPKLEK